MERVRATNQPIRWKKTGGGGFIFKGRLIKPGQVFTAHPDEVPKAFRDVCIPLDEIPAPPPQEEIEYVASAYTVKPRGNSNTWFDVYDANDKKINEKALTRATAEQLAKDLAG